MFQQGTKNLYVYLPVDNPQMKAFAELYEGVFDEQYSRWRFSNIHKQKILSEIETPPSDSDSDSDLEATAKPSDDEKSPLRLDIRLHRAQSFSGYDSKSESDNEDFNLSLDHKDRKKLSSAQFNSKRHKISKCIENCKHAYDN